MVEETGMPVDSAAFERFAEHLRSLAQDVTAIGECVARLDVRADLAEAPDTIVGLQKIDYVQQALFDLGRLCDHLAADAYARRRISLPLKLQSTRAILDGALAPQTDDADAEIDFF